MLKMVEATFCGVCEGAKCPSPVGESGGILPRVKLKYTRKWSNSKVFWENISKNLYHYVPAEIRNIP